MHQVLLELIRANTALVGPTCGAPCQKQLINHPPKIPASIRDEEGGSEARGGFTVQSRQSAKPFLQSSKLGLTHPLSRRRVCPPNPVLGGEANSLAGEGLGEYQFRRGDIHCGALYI